MSTLHSLQHLILASHNKGKHRELAAQLAPLGIQLQLQSELGLEAADEPHATFVENALAKARHLAKHSKQPALADDSGLVVPALQGAPGVHSARYAGVHGDDHANNCALLSAMHDIRGNARQAFFYCVLVLVRTADDPIPIICEGRLEGEILLAASGSNGFGYDPVFGLPSGNSSLAECSPAEKNRISHRAKALQILIAKLT